MNERVKRLAEEAKKLSHEERAELCDELLISLHDDDNAIDKAWIAEAEQRLEAFRRGECLSAPAEVVLARLGRTMK